MIRETLKALVFDVFGTVVDWRGSIAEQGRALEPALGKTVDWLAFAEDWRAGYRPGIERVRNGADPWRDTDQIHRARLDELVPAFGLESLSEDQIADLNRAWHRLSPWPDSVAGLGRLKRGYILSTLSNGTFACLVTMAKAAGLPWDCVISADMLRHYKPDPEIYHAAPSLMGLRADQVMLVAAHNSDLSHAAAQGLRTAFVVRREEYGPSQSTDLKAEGDWDFVAESLTDLAGQMGL